MLKMTRVVGLLACVLIFCGLAAVVARMPQKAKSPLDAATLVALVAGNALPENIVAIVSTRGLTFTVTQDDIAQLTTAGATSEVLKAVSKAAVYADEGEAESKKDADAREHLEQAARRRPPDS